MWLFALHTRWPVRLSGVMCGTSAPARELKPRYRRAFSQVDPTRLVVTAESEQLDYIPQIFGRIRYRVSDQRVPHVELRS
jgi:hypothetical protein